MSEAYMMFSSVESQDGASGICHTVWTSHHVTLHDQWIFGHDYSIVAQFQPIMGFQTTLEHMPLTALHNYKSGWDGLY